KDGIAGDIAPKVTQMFEGIRRWLVTTDEHGQSMGMSLRHLGPSLAIYGWRVLSILLDEVNPDSVRGLLGEFRGFDPLPLVRVIELAIPEIRDAAAVMQTLANFVSWAMRPFSG